MILNRLGLAGLIAGLGLAMSACTDGYGYGPVGYASDYYGAGYGPGFGPEYGYGPTSYFGWYGDYYYPGTGSYVYDRYRRPVRWNGTQQRYWQDRGRGYRRDGAAIRNNWQSFHQNRGDATFARPALQSDPRGGTGRRFGGERFGGGRRGAERLGGERRGGERLGGERLGGERRGGERPAGERLGGSGQRSPGQWQGRSANQGPRRGGGRR